MKKHYDCNNCDNSSCRGDTVRNERFEFRKVVICRGWKKPVPMKTPLLMIALEHKGCGTVLNYLFKKANIKFHEVNKYPYFKLEMNGG